MADAVLLERAREHFTQLGWDVEEAPVLRQGSFVFRPDLLARRGPRLKAVRVDDEALGAYPIGAFAAMCKKFHVPGVVVCPPSQEVVDVCLERGVEFVSPEGLGEALFPRPAPVTPEPVAEPDPVVSVSAAPPVSMVRAWRWVVVAIIWLAAIYFSVKFLLEVVA